MKAITLWQPWATLVAVGAKQRETRSWATQHHGSLAIHAAAKSPAEALNKCWQSPFFEELERAGLMVWTLPSGCIVATCQLVTCVQINEHNAPPEPERSFGDYTPGCWMWILDNIKQLPEPIPAKGRQGLWEWER